MSTAAYQSIRQRIISGRYAPGSRLVNRAIANDLGTSMVPVREALQRLASEGFVNYIPNAGAFVREFDLRSILKLYDLREQLETFAAVEAAKRMDEHHLHRLQSIMSGWRDLAHEIRDSETQSGTQEQFVRWIEFDVAFHGVVFEAADNPWLLKVINDLHLLAQMSESKPAHLPLNEVALTYRQHQRIFRAIRRGDAERARQAMAVHMREGREAALKYFDEKNGNGRPDNPRQRRGSPATVAI